MDQELIDLLNEAADELGFVVGQLGEVEIDPDTANLQKRLREKAEAVKNQLLFNS